MADRHGQRVGRVPRGVLTAEKLLHAPGDQLLLGVPHPGHGHLDGGGRVVDHGEATATGHRVQVMGMSHYHWKNGKIVDEWNVYDELSLLVQVKLGQMAAEAGVAD